MGIAIVTGSGGSIGSEACIDLCGKGLDVWGVDNDLRAHFFGSKASTRWRTRKLVARLGKRFRHVDADIRDATAMQELIASAGRDLELVVHCAAQPSHDWAAREATTDFSVNALGTLVLLEACRDGAPQAVFVFMSTNKVYGDTPNSLPIVGARSVACLLRQGNRRGNVDRPVDPQASSVPRRSRRTSSCRSMRATSDSRQRAFAAAA